MKKKSMTEFEYLTSRANDVTKNLIILNQEGEILNNDDVNMAIVNLITGDKVAKIGNGVKYLSIKNSNDFINDNLGYYFHLLYGKVLKMDIDNKMLARFLYLCTFVNYKNLMVYNNKRVVKESELQSILKLTKSRFFETKKYLLEKKLIHIDKESNVHISKELVERGRLKRMSKGMEKVRIFNEGYKELYEGVKTTQHGKLALFIKLLPLVNTKFNVISKKVDSTSFDESEPMTSVDIAKYLGVEKPSRLIKDLLSLKINNQFAMIKVVRGDRDFFVVNPRLYYKSNDLKSLRYIMNFFEYKKS